MYLPNLILVLLATNFLLVTLRVINSRIKKIFVSYEYTFKIVPQVEVTGIQILSHYKEKMANSTWETQRRNMHLRMIYAGFTLF